MAKPAPTWLSKEAKSYFLKLRRQIGKITLQQEHLLSMLANERENYLSSNRELQTHADAQGSLSVTAANGALVSHPAFRIQKQALDSYIKLSRSLRISLERSDGSNALQDELETFLEGG